MAQIKGATENKAYMRGMQELRRSNAARPIPSKRRYQRRPKHRNRVEGE